MRSLRATAILVIVTASCARRVPTPSPPRPEAVVLTVVTWNMHGDSGDLPRLLTDLKTGRLTAGVTSDFALLVQEASEDGIQTLVAQAIPRALTAFFVPVRRGPGRTSGNAIVTSRALTGERIIDLPQERQPRAAALGIIDVAGVQLFVVSAHLENRLGWLRGLFGDRARGRQAEALIAALPTDMPGIVGGDMNTMLGPNEPAWRALLERFVDTPRDKPVPTFRDRLVLDHLFFDLPDGWKATQHVIPDRYGSDHHPVLGVIAKGR